MKKALRIIGYIVLLFLALGAFLMTLGTIVTIPVVSSLVNYATIEYSHIFLPLCVALSVLSALMLIGKHRAVPVVLVALFVASLCMGGVAVGRTVQALRAEGADVGFFDVYRTHDFSAVQMDTEVYTTSSRGDVLLDVYYLPDEAATDRPIIIYIHGGGWTEGDRTKQAYRSRLFAMADYVSVSVDYDLSGPDAHLAATTEAQLTYAVAYMATNAARFGASKDRIYLIGDSAGGNLALDLAYKINDGTFAMAGETILPRIQGVCALYPVADPVLFYNNDDTLFGGPVKTMAQYYVGATPDEDPAAYAAITARNYLCADTPRTLLIVGTADTVVQPEASYDLYRRLQANGTTARLVEVPYANHAFDYVDGSFANNAVAQLTMAFFAD